MRNKDIYQGAVDEWLGHYILPVVGVDYSTDNFYFYKLSDDKALFLDNNEELIIELERRKISTYFGYSVKLNLINSTLRVFTLEREFIDDQESYRTERFTGSLTNALDIFKKNFKGRNQWPR